MDRIAPTRIIDQDTTPSNEPIAGIIKDDRVNPSRDGNIAMIRLRKRPIEER